jgi:hypothetical protein
MLVYREAPSVTSVANAISEQRPVPELIIVDDASRDSTWEALLPLACWIALRLAHASASACCPSPQTDS